MRSVDLRLAEHERPLDARQIAERMHPVLGPCIDLFGPPRCMFESKFPVDKASYSSRTCWNTVKRPPASTASNRHRKKQKEIHEHHRNP